MAAEAGVSVGTVSRVLNRHPAVDADIRNKVETAMSRLGYEPNLLARSMRQQKSMTVGCIIRDISIPALGAFAKSAQDTLFDADYSLVVGNSHGMAEREAKLISRFVHTQADGLILSLTTEGNPDYLQALQRKNYPVVLIDREGPDWADAVIADHETGTRQAVGYLLGLGHRNIALITGAGETFPARARALGYRAAYRAAGLSADEGLVRDESYLAEYALSELSTLLRSRDRPTAVLAGGMDMLPGVLRAIRNSRLSIPDDISVVASSDNTLTQLATPSIGVVRWDLAEVGRTAARLLLKRITNGSAARSPQRVMVSTEFLPRESCAPPRT